MKRAHFRVVGKLNRAGGVTEGTVSIDRGAGLFDVRPLRSRKVYTLPLSDVATMVCQRLIRAEVMQKRFAKAAKRKSLTLLRSAR